MDDDGDIGGASLKKTSQAWGAAKYVFVHMPAIIPASLAAYAATLFFPQTAEAAFWRILAVLGIFAVSSVLFWLLLLFIHSRMEIVADDSRRLRYLILFGVYLFAVYAIPVGVLAWELTSANEIATAISAAIAGLIGYFLFKNRIKK